MPERVTTLCPAKVNLTLHVTGRRADGYHTLESLVVFADEGDRLTLEPGAGLALTVTGPQAGHAGPDADNLVLRAARALMDRVPGLAAGHLHLDKRLPAAAGLGGGSSDAAGALRLLARRNGLPLDDPRLVAAAAATGADVTVCLDPRPALMRGIGHDVTRLTLPPLPAVLVNPRVAVETRAVFTALGLRPGQSHDGPPHPALPASEDPAALLAMLQAARNDLAAPAWRVAPVIVEVETALAATHPRLVRMSGSGATVTALYATGEEATRAAAALTDAHPAWWVLATTLGATP